MQFSIPCCNGKDLRSCSWYTVNLVARDQWDDNSWAHFLLQTMGFRSLLEKLIGSVILDQYALSSCVQQRMGLSDFPNCELLWNLGLNICPGEPEVQETREYIMTPSSSLKKGSTKSLISGVLEGEYFVHILNALPFFPLCIRPISVSPCLSVFSLSVCLSHTSQHSSSNWRNVREDYRIWPYKGQIILTL